MKSDTHLPLIADAKVTCSSCGAVFKIPGTKKEMTIEVCSNCHPVYTGKFRAVTSSGRVERFQKKMASAKKAEAVKKPNKRKISSEEKLKAKLAEAKKEKDEKKKAVAAKNRERAKKAAKKTIVKKGNTKKEVTKKAKSTRKKKK